MTEPIRGTVRVKDGCAEVTVVVPLSPPNPANPDQVAEFVGPVEAPDPSGPAWHSSDFSVVTWRGQSFRFSPKQRVIVAALWQARLEGYEWIRQEALLEAAESDCQRVRDLFKGHAAWGTLIVPAVLSGGPMAAYRLAEE